ncbi:MAG: DUF2459 domain-containing protein [Bacteroidota bacterium]
MKILKKLGKWCLILLAIPLMYFIVSLTLTAITVNSKNIIHNKTHTIFLSTNGVHLDIVLPVTDIHPDLLKGLVHSSTDNYLAFGWGEENFYLNTPTWADLTFHNAFRAAFLKSATLMHVTRFENRGKKWVKILVTPHELDLLNQHILNSFVTDPRANKRILENQGYTPRDEFYKANGSYSLFNTCNTWVNSVFKKSGLKACLWTPFDFGLLNKHK